MTIGTKDYWQGKLIDDMSTEELREALKELGRLYQQALERVISVHETSRILYRGRK